MGKESYSVAEKLLPRLNAVAFLDSIVWVESRYGLAEFKQWLMKLNLILALGCEVLV